MSRDEVGLFTRMMNGTLTMLGVDLFPPTERPLQWWVRWYALISSD